jgi:hypothetical protein
MSMKKWSKVIPWGRGCAPDIPPDAQVQRVYVSGGKLVDKTKSDIGHPMRHLNWDTYENFQVLAYRYTLPEEKPLVKVDGRFYPSNPDLGLYHGHSTYGCISFTIIYDPNKDELKIERGKE